jgi:hypothetical protein
MSIDDVDQEVVAAMGQLGFAPLGPPKEVTAGSYFRRFGDDVRPMTVYLNALEVANNSSPELRARLCRSRVFIAVRSSASSSGQA